jgi:hypothetical protein
MGPEPGVVREKALNGKDQRKWNIPGKKATKSKRKRRIVVV